MRRRVSRREKVRDEVKVVRSRVQIIKGLMGHGEEFRFYSE